MSDAAAKTEQPSSGEAIFKRLQGWVKADYGSEPQTHWRKEAREDFDFEAGEQLSQDDRNILKEAGRPIVIFNRVGAYIDNVAGQEIANRQEVQFLPRTQGAVKVNELLTSAAKWFRQQCDAEDEESDAFRDMVVCGMGWTETRLDYEDNPKGDPLVDHTDPLSMGWDRDAKKRNLRDARRVFQIKRDVPIEEARALCPGDPARPFEDSDYHASWVDDIDAKPEGEPHENDGRFYNKENLASDDDSSSDDDKTVTLVRIQWWERVPAWLTVDPADPTGQNIKTMFDDEYREFAQRYKLANAPMPRVVKTTRKVYRQAYLGSVLLEIGDTPCNGHFSFKCMTAKRDRNKNTFYGLVRAMKDPARWANKWMSQTMHIMNTTAKGGIAVEKGQFFHNDAQGEDSWARQDEITWLKTGALSGANGPKFIPKPTSQFPQSSFEMMNFAVGSLGAVTGINLEALGMQQSVGQAASLDLQRKQAVLTILQPLFDSLRRYRKDQGRVLMYLIEHYLADGRLIKIEGQDQAQYVPLIRQEAFTGNSEYDIIVDEAPTSANQKELTWSLLQQLLPVIGKMLPPQTWLALLKYSPLPTSAQQDIAQSIQQGGQQPDPEQQKRDAELQLEKDKAAHKMASDKAASDAKIQQMRDESAAKIQIDREHAHNQIVLKALTAPPTVDAEGKPVQGSGGGEAAAAIMGLMQQMRQEQAEMQRTMGQLAQALTAPKQLVRDANGDIIGIQPMSGNA
ncbi:MAG: phage portal protein [Thaumarchaeota archaeon]|nr:phage portal protein [Nitrososphaerota archaeon]